MKLFFRIKGQKCIFESQGAHVLSTPPGKWVQYFRGSSPIWIVTIFWASSISYSNFKNTQYIRLWLFKDWMSKDYFVLCWIPAHDTLPPNQLPVRWGGWGATSLGAVSGLRPRNVKGSETRSWAPHGVSLIGCLREKLPRRAEAGAWNSPSCHPAAQAGHGRWVHRWATLQKTGLSP